MNVVWGPWIEDGESRSCEGQAGDAVVTVSVRTDGVAVVESFALGSNEPLGAELKARLEVEARAHADELRDAVSEVTP